MWIFIGRVMFSFMLLKLSALLLLSFSSAHIHGHLSNFLLLCALVPLVKDKLGDLLQEKLKCEKCGKIVCYTDDCTFIASHKDPIIVQNIIENDFKKISNYNTDNKLFLNSNKTHLLIMTSAQAHKSHEDYGIKLNTGSEIILPSQQERLLGANVTNDFLWKDHLRDNKKSVILTQKWKTMLFLSSVTIPPFWWGKW